VVLTQSPSQRVGSTSAFALRSTMSTSRILRSLLALTHGYSSRERREFVVSGEREIRLFWCGNRFQ
jgi:hypothetical protein